MGKKRWQIIVHRKAEKSLKRLKGDMLERIRRVIRSLEDEPRPAGSRKLAGYENLYRLRVGDWRIIYAVEEDKLIVLVLEVAPRGSAYRDF